MISAPLHAQCTCRVPHTDGGYDDVCYRRLAGAAAMVMNPSFQADVTDRRIQCIEYLLMTKINRRTDNQLQAKRRGRKRVALFVCASLVSRRNYYRPTCWQIFRRQNQTNPPAIFPFSHFPFSISALQHYYDSKSLVIQQGSSTLPPPFNPNITDRVNQQQQQPSASCPKQPPTTCSANCS